MGISGSPAALKGHGAKSHGMTWESGKNGKPSNGGSSSRDTSPLGDSFRHYM